jgi:hypothetical protein
MTPSTADRWSIPPPVEAAAVRSRPGDPDRLARIVGLGAERMIESLAFLSGYAPGILDVILTATEQCLDDGPHREAVQRRPSPGHRLAPGREPRRHHRPLTS